MHRAGFLIALVTSCGFSWAQPKFLRKDIQVPGQYQFFSIQPRTGGIAIGDFDGDGRPDLLVGSLGGIDVLLNSGGGTFGRPIHSSTEFSEHVVTADFNGDGKLDLIVPDPGRGIAHLLLGHGDGTFSPPREMPGSLAAATADFNNDGKADLVVSGPLAVLLGNGDGTFRPGFRSLESPNQLTVADFNSDGNIDLAISSGDPWNGYSISIFLGNGDGSFRTAGSMPVRAATLLAADLNSDGLPDLITGYDILLGNGDGSFQAPRPYLTETDVIDVPVPFAAADFDGDGHLDLAVGSRYRYAVSNRVLIFRGRGDGTMLAPIEYSVGWQPAGGAMEDLDGDGRPDLAVANLTSNTVSLLLSSRARDSGLVRAVSTASGTAVVSPGSLATLYSPTAASVPAQANSPPWPMSLGGISLKVRDSGGAARLSPLLYVSGNQINFMVPEETALGEAALEIVTEAGSAPIGTMQVEAVAPAMFLATDYSLTPDAFLERLQPDGSRTSQPLFECSGPNACVPVKVEAPPPGTKSYLVFYGTGFHNANPGNVKCTIAGWAEFPIEYAGSSGKPGLDRISVPIEFYQDDDFWRTVYFSPMQEVVLSIDGVQANRALLFFSAPEPSCVFCK